MAHEYGHRRSIVGPWMRNLWDKIPDYPRGALGGMFPRYEGPQTQAEYQAGREPGGWQPTTGPGAAGLRQISKQIAGAGGWPGQGRGETQEAQMARIRRRHEGARDQPMALAPDEFGMYGQAQKDIASGKFAKEEEDDDMQKLLRYMFMSELMAGMAGGDPPTPYTVRAGPASRAFPTMPSMFG